MIGNIAFALFVLLVVAVTIVNSRFKKSYRNGNYYGEDAKTQCVIDFGLEFVEDVGKVLPLIKDIVRQKMEIAINDLDYGDKATSSLTSDELNAIFSLALAKSEAKVRALMVPILRKQERSGAPYVADWRVYLERQGSKLNLVSHIARK